ncbi:hypothetical protein [Aneurinibacillus aneurinilyticus]|uniref:hypothetical protein n=1 Tax=Aneurinibacillus aneurinilyticus TaxID=1391 RepID=UPI003523B227
MSIIREFKPATINFFYFGCFSTQHIMLCHTYWLSIYLEVRCTRRRVLASFSHKEGTRCGDGPLWIVLDNQHP